MKSDGARKVVKRSNGSKLFARGDQDWNLGKLKSALALFKRAASKGDTGALLNVGYFYEQGLGVRRNLATALRWYRKAYRRGDRSAANNIGTIYRDERRHEQALSWFKRAAKLGNDGSNLEIAKYYLKAGNDPKRACIFLRRVAESTRVSEMEKQAADQLLKRTRRLLAQ